MSETREAEAKCLCGAVGIKVKNVSESAGACHCDMCRRWGGGPLMATDCGEDVRIEGEEYVSVFDSSAWADRGFCSKCGTHLFYRIKQNGEHIIPLGLFGDEVSFTFDHQVFIDEKPGYYSFSNETRNMTGKEIFEKYGV